MARQNHGPLTRAKGKLGGVVYQQYEGMQIAREYQPNVKNPQSTKQTENRAKFKLSSQVVAQFKDVFNIRLAKLSIYTRTRRAACINAIYNVISTTTPSTPSALVDAVANAINAKSISGNNEVYFDTSDNARVVVAPSGYVVTYTNAIYDKTTGEFISLVTETYTSDGTEKTVEVNQECRNVMMATGYHALTEEGRATISDISTQDRSFDIAIARAIASGDIEVANIVAEVETYD